MKGSEATYIINRLQKEGLLNYFPIYSLTAYDDDYNFQKIKSCHNKCGKVFDLPKRATPILLFLP